MLKKMSTLFGLGLVVLWIAGLGSAEATPWLTWFDGLAALCAFGIAAFTPRYATRGTRMGQPIALAVGLFILWAVGLANGATPWLSWWNFVFGCAFLILGVAAGAERQVPGMGTLSDLDREREREKIRRSA